MRTLLIYDEVPEHSTIMLIEDAPDWLADLDGLYINSSDLTEEQEALMMRVTDACSTELDYCSDKTDPLACEWRKCVVEPRQVIEGQVQIIRCGFVM